VVRPSKTPLKNMKAVNLAEIINSIKYKAYRNSKSLLELVPPPEPK